MACNQRADYSLVAAPRRLPYVFALDTEASLLYPGEGENQRFCYTVEGVGEDTSAFVDLSHFVLGACAELRLNDILSAEVVIDGAPQTVTLGDNVSVRTQESPDPPTGCTGIKFDFGLDKTDGRMSFCFTLARAFAVGDVTLCVNGGQVTLDSLTICGPVCGAAAGDTVTVSQRASVCVPVTITPYAYTGVIDTQRCGEPTLTSGTATCAGNVGESCSFTVSQELCLNVPITFGATATPGQAYTACAAAQAAPCACSDVDFEGLYKGFF